MASITVYWRPMCGYCEQLKEQLRGRGIDFHEFDIWTDRSKAELVQQACGGDEIVPTVQVDQRFLINPTIDEVLEAAA